MMDRLNLCPSWPLKQDCSAMLDMPELWFGGDNLVCSTPSQTKFGALDTSADLDDDFKVPSPVCDNWWWADSQGSESPSCNKIPSPVTTTLDTQASTEYGDLSPIEKEQRDIYAEDTEIQPPKVRRGPRKYSLKRGRARACAPSAPPPGSKRASSDPAATRRRAHNNVERRYRNRLSDKFDQLLKLLDANRSPDTSAPSGQGEDTRLSKGAVLDLAIQRIRELEEKKTDITREKERMVAMFGYMTTPGLG
ncbi:hypothetical protein GQ53DRAFT_803682 [Thozetella sp. PMI_491]|nr:hypothetical protein GQ53DRAFT_803682 [Thozetella sp. PMI_491]